MRSESALVYLLDRTIVAFIPAEVNCQVASRRRRELKNGWPMPLAVLSLMPAQYLSMAGIDCCERVAICVIPMLYVTFQNVGERSSAIFKVESFTKPERLSVPT
jgi:hypothetical protein